MFSDIDKDIGAMVLRKFGSFLREPYSFAAMFETIKYDNKLSVLSPHFPVGVDVVPHENINIIDLIDSDNKVMNKVIAVFSTLCLEVKHLEEEAILRHFRFLVTYQECEKETEVMPQELISLNVESLHNLLTFISRCQDVCSNICTQIFGLYGSEVMNLGGVHLEFVLTSLSDVLVILVKLEVLINDGLLLDHWKKYRKAIKALYHYPEQNENNFSKERLNLLETVMDKLESQVLSDSIVQNALDNLLNLRKNLAEKSCAAVCEEFLHFIKKKINEIDKYPSEVSESHLSINWVRVNSLFALHNHLFGNMDKKLFKVLVDVNLKVPSVPLYGTALWYPEQFLQRHLTVLCQTYRKLPQLMAKARQNYLLNKKLAIAQDVAEAIVTINRWSLAMEEVFQDTSSQLDASQMNMRSQLIQQGVKFASQINFTISCIIALHTSQGLPMTKSLLLGICSLVEIIKGLNAVFAKNLPSILPSSLLISQHFTFQCIRLIKNTKKTMIVNKNYARQQLDGLTAFVVAEKVLNGPSTTERRVIASVALSMVPTGKYSEGGYQKMESLLSKIEIFTHIKILINKLCCFPSFSWLRTILPIYLANAYSTYQDPKNIALIFRALEESCHAVQTEGAEYKRKTYDNEITTYMDDQVIKPLGHQVETNLRLNIHSHLQLHSLNPFTTTQTTNTQTMLSLNDFRFMENYISVGRSIENYLSLTFYNLTTVMIHDWRSYGEMRQLAKFKYNLVTVQDNLPTQTLEQGLDVLEIMRNIHVFVSKYLYNLNNQIFIEQGSYNKHLNTINIKHIANSIRTHGTGIMNTTVNFTYQFLKKKFFTFSQFMYDEHIKSRLMKDLRYFRGTGTVTENMYNFKRADKFNKGIRNLGMTENGQSYLDLFRVLISQIGNAMGYVRMIRSGGLHCCANATVFLPTLDSSLEIKNLCERDNLTPEVTNAADNLECAVNNLLTNFSQGSEYFKLLVDVFAPVFRNPKNIHLKNFYMIVPPLTINYVENMILTKDRMNKKNKTGAAFTDDGFAMGLAYILKLLDQDIELNSLHWFESVWKHISEENQIIKEQKSKGSAQLQQALALTEKKIAILQNEFQLLFFSFSSARIFFQS